MELADLATSNIESSGFHDDLYYNEIFSAHFESTLRFLPKYQRNNKKGGRKHIRCFPCCASKHGANAACAIPVTIKCHAEGDVAEKSKYYVAIAQFLCDEEIRDGSKDYMKLEEDEVISAKTMKPLLRSLSNPLNPLYTARLGKLYCSHEVGFSQIDFVFKESCWHYGWTGGRYRADMSHHLRVYILSPFTDILIADLSTVDDDTLFRCVKTIDSPTFTIFSSRSLLPTTPYPKKSNSDGLADSSDTGSCSHKDINDESSDGEAQIQQQPSNKSKKAKGLKSDDVKLTKKRKRDASDAITHTVAPTANSTTTADSSEDNSKVIAHVNKESSKHDPAAIAIAAVVGASVAHDKKSMNKNNNGNERQKDTIIVIKKGKYVDKGKDNNKSLVQDGNKIKIARRITYNPQENLDIHHSSLQSDPLLKNSNIYQHQMGMEKHGVMLQQTTPQPPPHPVPYLQIIPPTVVPYPPQPYYNTMYEKAHLPPRQYSPSKINEISPQVAMTRVYDSGPLDSGYFEPIVSPSSALHSFLNNGSLQGYSSGIVSNIPSSQTYSFDPAMSNSGYANAKSGHARVDMIIDNAYNSYFGEDDRYLNQSPVYSVSSSSNSFNASATKQGRPQHHHHLQQQQQHLFPLDDTVQPGNREGNQTIPLLNRHGLVELDYQSGDILSDPTLAPLLDFDYLNNPVFIP